MNNTLPQFTRLLASATPGPLQDILTHEPSPNPLLRLARELRLQRDVERLSHTSFAWGFAMGSILASAFWLWLTWGAK